MKQLVPFSILVIMLSISPALSQAQDVTKADSITRADSLKQKALKAVSNNPNVKALASKLNTVNPTQQVGQLKQAATGKLNEATSSISKSLKQAKTPALSIDLNLEDAVRYNPQPTGLTPTGSQGFNNNFYVQGTLRAFGIPLNLNYSNDHSGFAGPGGQFNNLFKFDFNPAQFRQMFTSDMQQYYDLRKNAFAGLDIGSYTRKVVMEKLRSQETALAGKLDNGALTKYLEDPAKVTELLSMNEAQIKQKLSTIAQNEVKKEVPKELSGINPANPAGISAAVSKEATAKLQAETKGIGGLSGINPANPAGTITALAKQGEAKAQSGILGQFTANPALLKYLNNPASLKELQGLNEQQIAQKLLALNTQTAKPAPRPDELKDLDNLAPFGPYNISGYIMSQVDAKNKNDKQNIRNLAGQLYQSAQAPNNQSLTNIAMGSSLSTNKTIDSIAKTITGLKATLQKQGVDVSKMLQIQKYLDQGKGTLPPTELASTFVGRKPGNAVQNLFTAVQAFKVGSFGNQVPGGIQSPDRFVDGAHVTVKVGRIPLTAGYGSINDVASAKDAAYQGSVYSSPQNITYLGASMNQGSFGKVKIAVVSSFSGSGSGNSNYASPSGSSNNVALTLSKDMNMGKLGNVGFDVSKSTTLYQNKYQVGIDAPILAAKAGLPNNGYDLFEALGFGLTHHLEVKEAGLTDNIYFNYAGLGYQNPANNGYGGARMRLGGNLKKSFYKNKLVVTLRTDLRNTPISYTSNDQWKNYQVQLDSRYNVSKKFNISLKYSSNGTDKKVDDIITPVYAFHNLQVDGNLTYKIGKNYSVSHFSLGKQDYSNSYVAQGGGSLVMVNYTQSVVIRKTSLTANVFYNRELSSYSLIGNMLNTDVSYQYILFEKVSLSSGLTYLENAGITRQAGLRQGVRLFGGAHISMDSYVDIRKDMITPLYPGLYPSCMGELAIKYHFKD